MNGRAEQVRLEGRATSSLGLAVRFDEVVNAFAVFGDPGQNLLHLAEVDVSWVTLRKLTHLLEGCLEVLEVILDLVRGSIDGFLDARSCCFEPLRCSLFEAIGGVVLLEVEHDAAKRFYVGFTTTASEREHRSESERTEDSVYFFHWFLPVGRGGLHEPQ